MKHVKKLLITLLKIAASLGIIGYLFYSAVNTPDGRTAFVEMLKEHKEWGLLAAGFLALLSAVMITLVRWWYLVRALGIDFSLRDAMRIGFLGYLFNLAPMGIVGGDLLKAWMLAKERPGNRAKALASVIVDRIVGLYVLFLVASTGVFLTDFWHYPDARVHWICIGVLAVTGISTVGISLVLIPGFLEGRLVQAFTRIPKVGHAIDSLLQAIIIYRAKRVVLFWTAIATIPVHSLLTISLCLLGMGLGFQKDASIDSRINATEQRAAAVGNVSFRDYFAIYPVSGILSTIPLPAGPAETGIVFFYKTAWMRSLEPSGESAPLTDAAKEAQAKVAHQQGLILALVYRLSTILVAPIGAAYYFLGARREVEDVMHEHDEDDESESADTPSE